MRVPLQGCPPRFLSALDEEEDGLSVAAIRLLLFTGCRTGALQALCGKKERLARFGTESLAGLVAMIRKYGDCRVMERQLLLIGNAAVSRMQAGDEAAGDLHNRILDVMAGNRKPAGRGRRR